jgi:hypothetical protein
MELMMMAVTSRTINPLGQSYPAPIISKSGHKTLFSGLSCGVAIQDRLCTTNAPAILQSLYIAICLLVPRCTMSQPPTISNLIDPSRRNESISVIITSTDNLFHRRS